MKKIIIVLGILFIVCASMGFALNKTGNSGAQFLKIGIGARQVAMGEASVAIVDDANAMFWNPSRIALIEGTDVSASDNEWISDTRMMNIAAAHTFSWGTVGLHAIYMDFGSFDETNEETLGYLTGNTFTANDLAVGLSFARFLTSNFAIGGNVRYISETIDTNSAGNIAFDIGTTYNTGWNSLRMGIVIQNFGPDMQFDGTYQEAQRVSGYETKEFLPYPLPVLVRLGIAYDLLSSDANSLSLAVDALHPNDGDEKVNSGAEYVFKTGAADFAIRAGYRAFYDVGGLTAGAGATIHLGENKLKLDYAYTDLGILEMAHRVTLGYSF
jgi:hypothetical protein